eukprot:TRINITY_DN9403_c0_g1_i1.p1 TRINITY_DN9403_c0_g1~~TRINITY_DN9403_c0_g1_i1.p1  ORF type:complete len:720 (+),score=154.78 TRINITY_DN9403_c0_g1_i1:36-2162(+)
MAAESTPATEAKPAALPEDATPAMAVDGEGAEDSAEEKQCRFCFEGEEAGELISPCQCSGGQRYVHLSCLRMWQRSVISSQPTHPDLYDQDKRQRICNVCKSEFTCPPPTRTELMSSFTGAELAALIQEGSLIAAAKEFSDEMAANVSIVPEELQHEIPCRHWVRGVFLIVTVLQDRKRSGVMVHIHHEEDLEALTRQLESDGRTLSLRGRKFCVENQEGLSHVSPEASAEEWREAVRSLTPPVILRFVPVEQAEDCGEDGIIAVNLTRRFDLSDTRPYPLRARQKAEFCPAMARAQMDIGELPCEVIHLVGGPCEDSRVSACMLLANGVHVILRGSACVEEGIRMAASMSRRLNKKATSAATAKAGRRRKRRRKSKSRQQGEEAAASNQAAAATAGTDPCALAKARRRHEAGKRPARKARPLRCSKKRSCGNLWVGARRASQRLRRVVTRSKSWERFFKQATRRAVAAARPAATVALGADAEAAGGRLASLASGGSSAAVKLLVFWGYAGWSRVQLMGEIAKGSWGLCQSTPSDVNNHSSEDLYHAVVDRIMVAPKNAMSESYGGQAPAEEARRRELRRMAIFHHIIRSMGGVRNRLPSRAIPESADSSSEEHGEHARTPSLEEDSAATMRGAGADSSSSSSSSSSDEEEGRPGELVEGGPPDDEAPALDAAPRAAAVATADVADAPMDAPPEASQADAVGISAANC